MHKWVLTSLCLHQNLRAITGTDLGIHHIEHSGFQGNFVTLTTSTSLYLSTPHRPQSLVSEPRLLQQMY